MRTEFLLSLHSVNVDIVSLPGEFPGFDSNVLHISCVVKTPQGGSNLLIAKYSGSVGASAVALQAV